MNKNFKKRLRQGSLLDFIHISKMQKNMPESSSFLAASESSNAVTECAEQIGAASSKHTEPVQENGSNISESNTDIKNDVSDDNSDVRIKIENVVPTVSHKGTVSQVTNTLEDKSLPAESQITNTVTSEDELFPSESDSVDSISSSEKCSTDILKRCTQIPNILPPLRTSDGHVVLFNYNTIPGLAPLPYPSSYRDKWDNVHVRLPCSPESLYPVKNALSGEDELRPRWSIIQSALRNPILSTIDLEETILTYNTQYSKLWNFNGLHRLFTEEFEPSETKQFFENLLPKMIDLCLQIHDICTQPIPLLKSGRSFQITLSQKQIASLLANAFFCTFPRRNTQSKGSEYISYPPINFNTLYDPIGRPNKIEKLKCLINYFRCVTKNEPTGVVTFHRQCIDHFPEWKDSQKLLTNFCVQSEGLIEVDGMGMLQTDFANKFIGGGVLKSGCVQEEIRFVLCPELIVSRLFAERLDRNEALIVTGCEQFNQYTGYAETFCWAGNFEDCIPRDSWARKLTKVVAIDALRFTRPVEQYSPELIRREIDKAFAGFSEPTSAKTILPAVATGNWGCGAFRGDPRLKALIQLISAAEAGRDLLYLTFNDKQLEKDLCKMVYFLKSKNFKVGQLVRLLEDFYEQVVKSKGKESLYSYLFRRCSESDSETESSH